MNISWNILFNYQLMQVQFKDPRLDVDDVEQTLRRDYPELCRGDTTVRHIPRDFCETLPKNAMLVRPADPKSGVVKECYAVIFQQFSIPCENREAAERAAEDLYNRQIFLSLQVVGTIFDDRILSNSPRTT